jgi:hypothetical protein
VGGPAEKRNSCIPLESRAGSYGAGRCTRENVALTLTG